jgi:thymidylate synthase (FAD)
MKVKFISKTESVNKTAEELIVYCARVSSGKSEDEKLKNPEKLLKYCIDHEHWSIFEMADMTVEITTSIPISAQILRHKSFSFQQFSARYQAVQAFEPIEKNTKKIDKVRLKFSVLY